MILRLSYSHPYYEVIKHRVSVDRREVLVVFYVTVYAEIWRLLVLVRTRVFTWLPVLVRKSFFTSKRSSSPSPMGRNDVSCTWRQTIGFKVGVRTRAVLNCLESWCSEADSQFRCLESANLGSKFGGIKLDMFIRSRARCFLIWKVPGDGVDSLGSHGVWRIMAGHFFILILNSECVTVPTPGFLCICGMR
jgi:hypothetical protein